MKKSQLLNLIGVILLLFVVFSCDNEIHVTMPQGPAGKSAYDLWVEGVENGTIDWAKDRTSIEQFYLYMKGQDGKAGQDGLSAYELWVKEVQKGVDNPHNPGKEWDKSKTEVKDFWLFLTGADGKDGKNGSIPVIGDNGNWWIDGVDTGKPSKGADGKDGSKIEISNNQTWIIDGTDTGVPVTGKDGKDGSVVTIGDNGNWFIDGVDTTIPARGEKGDNGLDGTNGINGLSAYEVWVTEVMKGLENPHKPEENWDKSKISMDDFWFYLRGKAGVDGQNGQDGKDGDKVTIGDNGNWHINGNDTGVPAEGKNGQDGQEGDKVTIGDNGNWHINGNDTGVPAEGKNGQDGQDGDKVTIGDNGNWHINGSDTGVPAFGKNGQNGVDGLSAYELWKKEVSTGTVDDPKKPGQKWPTNKNSVQDFWEYLTGKDGQNGNDGSDGNDGVDGQSAYELWKEEVAKGLQNPHDPSGGDWPKDEVTVLDFWEFLKGKDGQDGKPGEPGKPGEAIPIIVGKFNVLAQFVHQEKNEYVSWTDGSVLYIVYDKTSQVAPFAEVKGLPGVDPNKSYIADGEGQFRVPKEDLPKDQSYFKSTAKVTFDGVSEESAPNTFVPAKVDVRLIIDSSAVPKVGTTIGVVFIVERRLSSAHKWEPIPSYLGDLGQLIKAYETVDPNYMGNTEIRRNISGKPTMSLARPIVKNKYLVNLKGVWDGRDHIMEFKLVSYYGESPICNHKLKLAPVQYVPIVTDLKRGNIIVDAGGDDVMQYISGKFHIDDLGIDYNLMFKNAYKLNGDTYVPIVEDPEVVKAKDCFGIKFTKAGSDGNNYVDNDFKASINNPNFSCNLAYVNSTVELLTNSQYFISLSGIGTIRENQLVPKQGWVQFPEIPIVKE